MNEDLFSGIKMVLEKISKAIEKGSCDDMRSYLADNQTATRNAIPYVRIDKINTIRKCFVFRFMCSHSLS